MGWRDSAVKVSSPEDNLEDSTIRSWKNRAKPQDISQEPKFENVNPEDSLLYSPKEKWDIKSANTPVDGPKGQETVRLPRPTNDMFEGMSADDADAVWRAYLRHPLTEKGWDGVSRYEDQEIPVPPQLQEGYDSPVEGLMDVAGGVWNAGKEVVVNKLAESNIQREGIDAVASPEGGMLSKLGNIALTAGRNILNPVGGISDVLPRDTAQTIDENVPEYRSDKGPVGDFLVTAGEWAPGGFGGAKLTEKALEKSGPVKKFIGKFAGSEAGGAYTMDNETINTLVGMNIPGFKGLGINPDGSFSENRVRQKLNMIQDALIVGSALGSVAKGTTKSVGYGWNLGKKLFDWQNMDSVQREMVSNLLEISNKINDNMSRQEINGVMSDMADYVANNIETVTKFGDPDIADVKHARDTITLMIQKLEQNPEANARQIQVLREFRSSALEGGKSPELITKLEQPRKNLENSLQQAKEAKGGDEAIDQSRKYLQNKADERVDAQRKEVFRAEDNLSKAERDTNAILRNDPSLGPQIREAEERNMPFDPYEGQNRSADEIAAEAKRAREEKWNPQRDERYAKIPADSKIVDPEGVKKQYEGVKESLSKESRARFEEYIKDGNYKNMTELAKQISQEAKGLQGPAKIDVENFSRYLKNSGDEESVRALREADEGFRMNEGRFNQGVTEELRDIDRADGWKTAEKTTQNRQAIEGAISNPKRAEEVKLLREQLSGIGAGQKIDDHIIGEAASTIKELIDSKGISKVSPQEVRGAFAKMAGGMSDQAKSRMEQVVRDFESGRVKVADLSERLTAMQKEADRIEEEFYGNKLREFFMKNPGMGNKYARNPDGYGAFEKFISDPKNSDRLTNDILPMLDKDPSFRKGAEVAVVKMLEKHLMQEGDKLKIPEGFEKMAEKVLPKEAIEGWKILTTSAKEAEAANKTRMGAGFNYNAWQEGAYSSTGTLLTWMFGVLNPTSAKIRTITKDYFKSHDPKDKVKQAADEVLSNPELFAKIARQIIDDNKSRMSPEMKQLIFRGTIAARKDHPDDSGNKSGYKKTMEQTEDMFKSKINPFD